MRVSDRLPHIPFTEAVQRLGGRGAVIDECRIMAEEFSRLLDADGMEAIDVRKLYKARCYLLDANEELENALKGIE